MALENVCGRLPIPLAVWIYQINTASGAGGSATMVVVFVV